MKRKLLAARRIEFCLSFLRLLSIIGFGVLAAYSLFGIISIFGIELLPRGYVEAEWK